MPDGREQTLLDDDQLIAFRQHAVDRHFEPGERLVSYGAASSEVFYLLGGLVKIVAFSPAGVESLFGMRTPGQFVGEMSTLNDEPRSADVIAVEATHALTATAVGFTAYLEANPDVMLSLLRMQGQRLNEMTRRAMLGTRSVRARVAQRLLDLAGPAPGSAVKLTHGDLAKYVDATREWTSKALGDLRREGAIRTRRGQVIVIDHAALLRASLEA